MTELDLFHLVVLPLGLGLLGFVEPCSIGSSMVLVKVIEGQSAATRIAQVVVFALTRALLIGALGALVALIGTVFIALQKGAWLLLGLLYIAIGTGYAVGRAGFLMRSLGPDCRGSRGWGARSASGCCSGSTSPPRGTSDLRDARHRSVGRLGPDGIGRVREPRSVRPGALGTAGAGSDLGGRAAVCSIGLQASPSGSRRSSGSC